MTIPAPRTPHRLCIMSFSLGRWFAWDEHGRLIGHRLWCGDLRNLCTSLGYTIASHHSPFARTVRDRIRYRYPSLANEAQERLENQL